MSKYSYQKIFFLFCIFCIVLGSLATIGLGISTFSKSMKMQQYETTTGEVIDILEKEDTVRRKSHGHSRTTTITVYAPVYEYEVDDISYVYYSDVYSSKRPSIGDTNTLYYDPDDPEDAFVSSSVIFSVIFIVFGVIYTTVFVIIAVILRKKMKAA